MSSDLPKYAIASVPGATNLREGSPVYVLHFDVPPVIARFSPHALDQGWALFAWTHPSGATVDHSLMEDIARMYLREVEMLDHLPTQWSYQFGSLSELMPGWLVADSPKDSSVRWAGLVLLGQHPCVFSVDDPNARSPKLKFNRWIGDPPDSDDGTIAMIERLKLEALAAWQLEFDSHR